MNISGASKATGVSADMIRFYEKKGLISPGRNPSNHYREYTDRDLFLIVMIRHYNCLGLSLEEIRELALTRNIPLMMEKLQTSIDRLREEQKWIAQRIVSAEDIQLSFELLDSPDEFRLMPVKTMYFYARASCENYGQLYAYQSAKPALRIKKDDVRTDPYPLDQGMLFSYPVMTDLGYDFYENSLVYKTLAKVPSGHLVGPSLILPLIEKMNRNGYKQTGDVFVVQILAGAESDTISVNIICEKA